MNWYYISTENKGNAMKKMCFDHTGKCFDSFSDMCHAWHRHHSTVFRRLQNGASLKSALCCDGWCYERGVTLEGVFYPTIKEACKEYGVAYTSVAYFRKAYKLTLLEAIKRACKGSFRKNL